MVVVVVEKKSFVMNKYIVIFALCCCSSAVLAFQYYGSGYDNIPDGPGECGELGEPLAITFDVENNTAVQRVALKMTIEHDAVGQLIVELEAPDQTRHLLFGQTGAFEGECVGDITDLDGTYVFTDSASEFWYNNWWFVAANLGGNDVMPAASYRTTAMGGTADAGLHTSMNEAFSHIENPNGTWTLYVYDNTDSGFGNVTGATLYINSPQVQISDGEAYYKTGLIGWGADLVTDIDYMDRFRWYYRLGNESREYAFNDPAPNYALYSDQGKAVTMTWLNLADKGFRADLTHVIDQTGLNPDQAILTSTMKITNLNDEDIDISLFNHGKFDLNGPSNDIAHLVNNDSSHIRQTDNPYQLEFRAGDNDRYQIDHDFVIFNQLIVDQDLDDLSNEGGDGFGPADIGTAFQWFSGPIAPGHSYQVQTTVAVGGITAPEPQAPLISDLIFMNGYD